jgi:hypothetical protein
MKYPDAALESDEVEAAAIPNMWACWDGKYVPFPEEEHEDHQIPLCMHRDHLKLSFWMHNARCSRTNQGKDSYLRKKDHDSAIDLPKKLDFINEVDSFLADSFFRGSLTQTVDPAFVSFLFSECCPHMLSYHNLPLHLMFISDGYGLVRPHR